MPLGPRPPLGPKKKDHVLFYFIEFVFFVFLLLLAYTAINLLSKSKGFKMPEFPDFFQSREDESAPLQDSATPRRLSATPPSGSLRSYYELEKLGILDMSRPFDHAVQSTAHLTGGKWAGDTHLFVSGTQKGDWIEFSLPRLMPGRYELSAYLSKAQDYGVVQFHINKRKIGRPLDLYSKGSVRPTGAVKLGYAELHGNEDILAVEIVGRNPANQAPYYQFAVDGISLRKVDFEK